MKTDNKEHPADVGCLFVLTGWLLGMFVPPEFFSVPNGWYVKYLLASVAIIWLSCGVTVILKYVTHRRTK